MKAAMIAPEDRAWRDFLARVPHDVYHLPEYVAFAAEQEGGTPVAFYAQDQSAGLLIPLVLRKLPAALQAPDHWLDATSPYGYPSPLLSSGEGASALGRLLAAFCQHAAEHAIVTAFIRLHPLLPLPAATLLDYGSLVHHGQTVYSDLSVPLEEIWRHTRKAHRYEMSRLSRLGFQVTMDDWELYPRFMALYRADMARLGASNFYFFDDSYFTGLREALGESLHLCSVLAPDGCVAAAGLFTMSSGIVQYHLSATEDRFRQLAPAKLMLDSVRRWAKDLSQRFLHLGGGVGAQSDSLFAFKAGFSDLRGEFTTFRIIVDEEKYQYLVQSWREQAAPSAVKAHQAFFPLYRAPMHSAPNPATEAHSPIAHQTGNLTTDRVHT